MSKYVFATACSVMLVGSSLAVATEPEPALGGYCPVCLEPVAQLIALKIRKRGSE